MTERDLEAERTPVMEAEIDANMILGCVEALATENPETLDSASVLEPLQKAHAILQGILIHHER
jgi:hypothetical protein